MSGDLQEITAPPPPNAVLSADKALAGPRIPPQQQVLLYSPDEWERFVHEWAHFCLKPAYHQVLQFAGSGDKGIDIAGFAGADGLQGIWDNFQCKHYARALGLSDALPEIGKCLWYSFNGDYVPPRAFAFVAPYGAGTKLAGCLANATLLRREVIEQWDSVIRAKITKTQEIQLTGPFLAYVEAFDFSIFTAKTSLQLVDDHRACPFHAARFGGGLPDRPRAGDPPVEIQPSESRYIAQLLAAYADHKKQPFTSLADLAAVKQLNEHFLRQREAFYHAEQLRVFARDTVPPGTFESLQDDVYSGVIDVHDAQHADGYERVCKVTQAARELQITANALIVRTNPKDRDGICHQLANEERLRWTRS